MFNILIVDDQKNMRESLAIAFKRAGYNVDSVEPERMPLNFRGITFMI